MGENCEHGTAVVDCSVCSDRAAAVHACVEAADDIERGKHEVDESDQCTDCGALIVCAHGCQGVPGDEES